MTAHGNDELRSALAAARAESEAKSRLIAHTSHEIRTNLAGVMGLAQAAQETRLTPEQQEFFELILGSGEAILTLVNDLLDLSKIEAGMLAVDVIAFDLHHTLEDIVSTYRSAFEEKHLTLGLRISDAVPTMVHGDPGRIRQVLANLVANAVRFTDAGGATIEVDVLAGGPDTVDVEFAVVDSGVGIPQDRRSAIFAPFAQADATVSRTRGGSGLGLSISRQLAEMMGGTLDVESTPGEGSRFMLRLTLGVAEDTSPHQEVGGTLDLGDLPVLVMSERPSAIKEAIGGGDLVDLATDEEAMNKHLSNALEQPYALLVLEGSTALELARVLRAREALDTTHIMILTPTGERGDAARCRELRVGGYLTAPYTDADVAAATAEVIAGPAPIDLTVLVTRHWLRERRRRLSILVVDDSPTLRMTSSRLLERRGHAVKTVSSGADAIAAVEVNRYDAIVMDINMPDMDGFEATEKIRRSEFGAEIPVIAVSSQASETAQDRIVAAGASELLARPFEVFELVAAIERALDGS